jgi:hypothetical protein
MKRLILSMIAVLTVSISTMAFGISGGGWVPGAPGDVDFILHTGASVTNTDTALSHRAQTSLGFFNPISCTNFQYRFYVNNNGLSEQCDVTLHSLTNGLDYGNFVLNFGSGPQTFLLTVSGVPSGHTLTVSGGCSIPKKNGSTQSFVYDAFFVTCS